MKCKWLMSYCQRAQVSYRLPYLQVQNQVDSEGAKVACLMTDTAKAKSKGEAKGGYTNNQTLLEKALPAGCFCCTIREKKVKVNVNCHIFTCLRKE